MIVSGAWPSGRAANKQTNPVHRFLAAGTQRPRPRCGCRQIGRFAVQQSEDALAFFAGRRTQPAEGTHALEARRQDVLEEAADKFFRLDLGWFPLSILAVFVRESDVLAVVGENA